MSKSINAGELAVDYLARHPGFENRLQLGELMAALSTRDGRRLGYGVALQQRLNDKIRQGVKVETYYEQKNGCIRRAYYWMKGAEATRILKTKAARKGAR